MRPRHRMMLCGFLICAGLYSLPDRFAGGKVPPATVRPQTTPEYLYVLSPPESRIYQYRICDDGTLKRLKAPDYPFLDLPKAIAFDPPTNSAYVMNGSGNDHGTVSVFRVGADGVLVPRTPASLPADRSPEALVVDSRGRAVYVLSSDSFTTNLWRYAIKPDGGLQAGVVRPLTKEVGTSCDALAIVPRTNTLLIAASRRRNGLLQYRLGPHGQITPGSPPAFYEPAGASSLVVSPDQRHIYVGNFDHTQNTGGSISVFTIDKRGQIHPAHPPQMFTEAAEIHYMTVSPQGNLYAFGYLVYCEILQATARGDLRQARETGPEIGGVGGIAISASGKYAYVVGNDLPAIPTPGYLYPLHVKKDGTLFPFAYSSAETNYQPYSIDTGAQPAAVATYRRTNSPPLHHTSTQR